MSTEPAVRVARLPQIGRYQPINRIATGGMGAVYKAWDIDNERAVALKVLSPEWTSKPVLLRRFQLEAHHGSQLGEHPNVVSFYESGETAGLHYLALEFVDGVDLKDYAAAVEHLDVHETRDIITQASRAIAHLYHHGITHRDVKPSNFLIVDREGKPHLKLIDLGLARNLEDDDESCRVTRPGTTLGTVDYIAPEQARNSGAADVRSDIYALGCTWFHLLAGRPPFPEGSITERILQHVETEPPDIRTLNPSVPDAMADVLHRMLAKDPADRYQTPAALIRELESLIIRKSRVTKDLLAGLANGQEATLAPRPTDRPRRRKTGSSQQLRVFQDDVDRAFAKKKSPRSRTRANWLLWPSVVGITCLIAGFLCVWALQQPVDPIPVVDDPPALSPATLAPQVEPLKPAPQTGITKRTPKVGPPTMPAVPPIRFPLDRSSLAFRDR